jgi:hypothetical protein
MNDRRLLDFYITIIVVNGNQRTMQDNLKNSL